MVIKKQAHFYASHRNQNLTGKCESLHGHQYEVVFHFVMGEKGSSGVTVLFEDLEASFKDVIKSFDHAALWDTNDPLYRHIYSDKRFTHMKCVLFTGPTSVENLCFKLFNEVYQNNPALVQIDVRETTSSVVSYRYTDYARDLGFPQQREQRSFDN